MNTHRLISAIGATCALAVAGFTGGTASAAAPAGTEACDPNYTGCVPIRDDVDCEDVGAEVSVIMRDIYELDADGDDFACEEPVGGDTGAGTDQGAASGDEATNGDGLAETGSSTTTLIGAATVVLVAGLLALMASRRRPA